MHTSDKLWTKPFTLLLLANLFAFMSFQMLIPTLPPHVQAIGGTEVQIGLVTTLFSLAAVIVRPFIGYILNSQKRKKHVVISLVALLTVTILYPFISIVAIFLILRFMHGMAWGWSTTSNGTAAVDLVPNSRIGEGMGYFSLSITLGMIIAPSLGIFLFQRYDFQMLVFISVALGLIALTLLAFTKMSVPAGIGQQKLSFKSFSLFRSLVDRRSAFPALITFLATFGYGSIVTFVVIFAQEKNLEHVFLFYLLNAVCATIVRPITGKWFDRRGPWSLVILCSLLSFAGMWILALAESNVQLAIAGTTFGLGYASMIPALQSWVLSKTTREKSGTANGMYYSAIDLGIGISALILGFVKPLVDTAALFELSSTCFVIVALLTYIDYVKQRKTTIEKDISG